MIVGHGELSNRVHAPVEWATMGYRHHDHHLKLETLRSLEQI